MEGLAGKTFQSIAVVTVTVAITLTLFLLCVGTRIVEDAIVSSLDGTSGELYGPVRDAIHSYLFYQKPFLPLFFTEHEKMHMYDVRNLFGLARFVMIVTWIAGVYFSLLSAGAQSFTRVVIYSAYVGIAGMGIGGIFVWLYFDQLFTTFHVLSFANDLWLLDPEIHILIRAYPPEFFEQFVLVTLTVILATFTLLLFVSRRALRLKV